MTVTETEKTIVTKWFIFIYNTLKVIRILCCINVNLNKIMERPECVIIVESIINILIVVQRFHYISKKLYFWKIFCVCKCVTVPFPNVCLHVKSMNFCVFCKLCT